MNWTEQKTDGYEMFWHITTKDNVETIKKNGLIQYDDIGLNSYGLGIYCIKQNEDDLTQLHNIIQFMENQDIPQSELVIVEFEYMGDYFINETGSNIYQEEGWIIIQDNIPSIHIENIFNTKEI